MNQFQNIINYFCDYELYDNLLNHKIQSGNSKEILLNGNVNYTFKKAIIALKSTVISNTLKLKVIDESSTNYITSYLEGTCNAADLIINLNVDKNNSLKYKIKEIEAEKSKREFCVFYPVFLNHIPKKGDLNKVETFKQPLLTFACSLTDDRIDIIKLYLNQDIVSVILAQLFNKNNEDIQIEYRSQLNDLVNAVNSIQNAGDINDYYAIFRKEFKAIFNVSFPKHLSSGLLQLLEHGVLTIDPYEKIIQSSFRNELTTLRNIYSEDNTLPSTLSKYLLGNECSIDYSLVNLDNKFHHGSYQNEYPINQKQWQLLQLAKQSEVLCVEGPPGTGKTTLLKEIFADTMVQKAGALLKVWNESWRDTGNAGKDVLCSPLGGKNLYSIVVSSTNNTAVNNIGVELLKEIPFFQNFAEAVSQRDDISKYIDSLAGICCAKLGNKDNVKGFYEYIFHPFCDFLARQELDLQEEQQRIETYTNLLSELDAVNSNINYLLSLRKELQKEIHGDSIADTMQNLNAKCTDLQKNIRNVQNSISRDKSIRKTLNEELGKKINALYFLEEKKKDIENTIASLSHALNVYSSAGKLKKAFSFLFKELHEVCKNFSSIEAINESLEEANAALLDQKKYIFDLIKQKKVLELSKTGLNTSIIQNENRESMLTEQLSALKRRLSRLNLYINQIYELRNHPLFSDVDILNADKYNLSNSEGIYLLRERLFTASMRVFEAYIIKHKKPILSNLRKAFKFDEFARWCSDFYNGERPFTPERASYVRMLWETFFLCFPLVTTTLHSFDKKTFYLIPELIDCILFDECGQIVPYYVAGPLYRARKAIFVGDTNQIEPVRTVPSNLLDEKYADIFTHDDYSRLNIDRASAQSYAHCASDYYEVVNNLKSGIILNEHRRCEKSIMYFSNTHIYQDILTLHNKDNQDKPFEANLVAFDIRGLKAKQHYNDSEIDACLEIIRYITNWNAKLDKKHPLYSENIMEDIGIITPFRMQCERLEKRLSTSGIRVGTVNRFQGQEKKYIVFSSVIDGRKNQYNGLSNFIGSKGNLLNVAFSRAKSQFIFVGNFNAAQESNNYLSKAFASIKNHGKLYSLFNDEYIYEPEITTILAGKPKYNIDDIGAYLSKKIPLGIISSAKEHNEILNRLVSSARKSIYIISPWINTNVVTNDFLSLIDFKVQNNTTIKIIFGYNGTAQLINENNISAIVDANGGYSKETAVIAVSELFKRIKDNLKYAPPNHTKILLIDDKYLFVGSLNWLSNAGKSKNPQKEISCLLTRKDSIEYVKEAYFSV